MPISYDRSEIFRNFCQVQTDDRRRYQLQKCAINNLALVQRMKLVRKLPVHNGCVNTVQWNRDGTLLLSGSDDRCLVLTNAHEYKVRWKCRTPHRTNIFCAKFLCNGNDSNIVSCAGDGSVLHTDLNVGKPSSDSLFLCHYGGAYEVEPLPSEPTCFISCGEDGTVRWFDLRLEENCSTAHCDKNIIIACDRAVTAITCNPLRPYQIAVGAADSVIRLYDHRYIKPCRSSDTGTEYMESVLAFNITGLNSRTRRVTSLSFSPESHDQSILVSYCSEDVYLLGIQDALIRELRVPETSSSTNSVLRRDRERRRMPKLRFRGDWSDTGPDSRPEGEAAMSDAAIVGEAPEGGPSLHHTLMHRMTQLLSRILSDPVTRAAALHSPPRENETAETGPKRGSTHRSTPLDEPVVTLPIRQHYKGHRNVRTMIKEAAFWGNDYIMSGSDCGHCFIWDRHSGSLVMLLRGDNRVLNCVQPHPTLPYLATSGIDYDIKLWAPFGEISDFDMDAAQNLVTRNIQIVDETRDTITIPASFMIRMIARLHEHRRQMTNNPESRSEDSQSSPDNEQPEGDNMEEN